MLLSQQFILLSTEFFQRLSLLSALLVKQGYFFAFGDNFILNELGYSGMLLVPVKGLQHGANGGFTDGRTHSFYRSSFDDTQMVKAFTRGVKAFLLIQHVHIGGGHGR